MTKRRANTKTSRPQKVSSTTRTFNTDAITHHLAIVSVIAIAILAAIPFAIGKYMELSVPGAFDSGAYVYSAQHILSGAQLGVTEIPSAQAGTLLVNMAGVWLFGFSETGPIIIQAILQAGALILMFVAMNKLFGKISAAVGVIIAATYLSAPLVAKFGNVKEQYMIAFMVLGISSLILRQLDGKWLWAFAAGAFLSWGPLFKQTGASAIIATAIFIILQPFFHNRTWKQTFTDIALMFAGAAAALTPVYIWLAASDAPIQYFPYSFVVIVTKGLFQSSPPNPATASSYISGARKLMTLSEQAGKVFRFWHLLILPIALALASIIARIVRLFTLRKNTKLKPIPSDRFVILLAIWWILDMAFVWISPRSYEQYYLPLNASAAMLAGYIVALYANRLKHSQFKPKWIVTGLLSLMLMTCLAWPIFAGTTTSPHSGTKYPNNQRRFGYAQQLQEAKGYHHGFKGPWQQAALYIRDHSKPTDGIYVWGWFPGIYVQAQRLSPSPKAFYSEMHVEAPERLAERISDMVSIFQQDPPKFFVDTHKSHYPWNRPPLELWPSTKQGFIPNDPQAIKQYENAYYDLLEKNIGEDEAQRFIAMKPLRDFIMQNYRIAQVFDGQVVFERIN